jgi:hypothetical protein
MTFDDRKKPYGCLPLMLASALIWGGIVSIFWLVAAR